MLMVALSDELVDALGDLAVEIREGFESGAWSIGEALSLHPAFEDTNLPRSALTRAIIASEFRKAADRRGLTVRSGMGGATELYEMSRSEYAVIRLRGASMMGEELRVIANSGSTWGGLSDDGFWREVPYVFGFMVTDNDSVNFFVAEVVGQSAGAVPHLEFGWTHYFGPPAPTGDSVFLPDDDDSLDGWDAPDSGEIDKQA